MITNLKFIIISINKVWLNLKLQTQLILTAGAVISFSIGSFMSGLYSRFKMQIVLMTEESSVM